MIPENKIPHDSHVYKAKKGKQVYITAGSYAKHVVNSQTNRAARPFKDYDKKGI